MRGIFTGRIEEAAQTACLGKKFRWWGGRRVGLGSRSIKTG